MKLSDFISKSAICADLKSTGKVDVLAELGEMLADNCAAGTKNEITAILVERERLASTGVGQGVAIPHGKLERLGGIAGAIGISRTGVEFEATDDQPVHIFVALLAPLDSKGDHLKALARISRLLKDPDVRTRLLEARSAEAIHDLLVAENGNSRPAE